MENRIKFIRGDVQKPENELKHYGVLGMKWGVRKDDDKSSMKGPISNKYYAFGNRSFFKNGVKGIKASSSSSSSARSSGSSYVLKFDKTRFDKVKAWKNSKKKSSGKSGGSGKKSTGTKTKAEEALKEKIASASKSGSNSSGKGGKSDSGGGGSSVSNKSASSLETLEDEILEENKDLVSVDPDFDEKYFTDENKLGSTNFYAYKNDNGVWVISDKEKKWVLPEGMEIDKKDFTEKLEKFEQALKDIIEVTGYEYTEEELDMWYTAAINKIISELRTPQQAAMEQVAEVINNLLNEQEYEDKSSNTKIGDNVSTVLKELEEKKKR